MPAYDDENHCCRSPQLDFTIRNDGQEPLANDTRVAITLPAGIISVEGLKAVQRYLQNKAMRIYSENRYAYNNVSYDVWTIGDEWQNREGNFTKRLSRRAYQMYDLKLSPDDLSAVGTIARDHSKAFDMQIEVTRRLNRSSRFFGNHGSCWWGSYGESRCAFKTNGGFALRSLSEWGGSDPTGRAWVLPLKQVTSGGQLTRSLAPPRNHLGRFIRRPRQDSYLLPTFDTLTPDAMVVFNGYGDLDGYMPARILSYMLGCTYKKIGFYADPMYINAGGYLVAPEAIAQNVNEVTVDLRRHSTLFETETEKGQLNAA